MLWAFNATGKMIINVFLRMARHEQVNEGTEETRRMAERGGFEPPVELPLRRFSKPLP